MRLSKCFEELRLFQDHMIGSRPDMRTSNIMVQRGLSSLRPTEVILTHERKV